MRSLMAAILVAGVIGLHAQTPASGPSTSVSGVVRDVASRRPIAGARVSIMADGQGPGLGATTGDDGRFFLEGVTPGAYSLVVIKPPYANGFFPESTSLRVDGRPVDGLDLVLVPGAVITGQVIDPFGQPAAGVDVNIRRVGSPRLQQLFAGPLGHYQTDENGRYRYFALAAGDYLVSARGLIFAPDARMGSNDGASINYATVYFPDVLDPSQAQLVTVSPGEERTNIDFRLRLTGLRNLTGVVTGLPDAAGRSAMVILRPLRSEVAETLPYIAFATASGSNFKLNAVPPGRYWLTARLDPAIYSDPARDKATAYWAATEVVVGDNDVSGITLALQAATTVSGRVTVAPADGSAATAPSAPVQVSLTAADGTPRIFDSLAAMSDSGGAFSVPKVPAGRYRVLVREGQVAAVVVGDVTTTEGIVTVPAGGLKDVVVVLKRIN